jgi:translation initiation factor 1 (eIF-1/SUI1)
LAGVKVQDERLITLVCRVPEHADIDLETLQRALKSRLAARVARADDQVQITAGLLGRWVREEMETLLAQLSRARQPLN